MPRIDAMSSWFREAMGRHSSPVSRILLFGSILTAESPNDVDAILISGEWDIRDSCRELKSDFLRKFGLPLHLQIFHASQSTDIESFINRAKTVEEVL
jgi:hypothetical protein